MKTLLALFLLAAGSAPAAADTMQYFMRNAHPRAVVIELRSQQSERRWPGDGKVFLLEKGEKKMVPVECTAGETICYGAWVNGNDRISWGIGPEGDGACDNCCVSCVEKGQPELTIE